MSKLHEVLAVDGDLQETSKKVIAEAVNTFNKKANLFVGADKRLNMFDDARKQEEEGQNEFKPLHTTVMDKLTYVAGHVKKYYDAIAQKESTNQIAKADVVMPDGTVLLHSIPATLLLGMESRLAKLRQMYEAIPTLDPGIRWVKDDSQKVGAYRNEEVEFRHKTEKTTTYAVMSEATKEHKAQIDKVTKDIPVGQYVTTYFCGMITPTEKSQLLGRIDTLIQAFKKARQRANETEVIGSEIGAKVFEFINGE